MSRSSRLVLLIAAVLIAGACTSEDPTGPSAPRNVTSGDCPNEAAAVADTSLRDDGRLLGDIDGDGAEDPVFLVRTTGEPECSVFLVAETSSGTLSAPAPPDEGGAALGLPALTGLAQIDGLPGLDAYLTVLAGASTEFLAVFSAGSGRLERLDRAGDGSEVLFPSGGSVAHLEASDCHEAGGVVVASAQRINGGWGAEFHYYVREGDSFVADDPSSGITPDPVGKLFRSFPEFRFTPFGSCSTSPE